MKLLGGILLAVGILIAGASGLCSAIFLVDGLASGGGGEVFAVLIIGGIPFAAGVACIIGGRALLRDKEE